MGYDLFTKLKKLNVTVKVTDGQLDIKAPKGVLDEELLIEIKTKKEDLINLIGKYTKDKANEKNQIPVAPKSEHYPLSSSQKRLWVLSQIDTANFSYNIPGLQVIEEVLNVNAFMLATQDLFNRHEILRTVFKSLDNEDVRQFVIAAEDFEFPFQQIDVDNDEVKLNEILAEVKNTIFDLEKGPLFKGVLVRVTDNKWVFSYNMHHIISDGWSMDIMINELLNNYILRRKDEFVSGLPLKIHYKDYAVWQQQRLADKEFDKEKNYWLTNLEGDLPTLAHFGDNPRPAIMTYNGSVVKRTIETLLIQRFKSFCQEQEGTLFMGCLSILNVLLHKYTEQEDFIIGSPVSGRTHKDLADQIGFYVNTVALRTQLEADNSFKEIFQQNKISTLNAIENQNYPFDELLDNLNVKRDLSRSPLFDVMISVQNENQLNQKADDLSYNEFLDRRVSKYDLTFTFVEKAASLTVELEYNMDIFSKETASTLLYHLENLLVEVLKNPSEEIKSINCLDSEEQFELLENFNNTEKQYPDTGSIVSFFREQVQKTPQNTALVYKDVSFTYLELDALSNQLSNYLEKQYLLDNEDFIAILLQKNEWQIIAILAILKAKCAYVPIASDYPESRIQFILEDTKCKLVITEEEIANFLNVQAEYSDVKTSSPLSPSHLAYVMYTSGSTGVPKGALIEHGGVIRLVKENNYVQLTGKEALLSTGSFSFDATTFEYWSMLLNGGKLVLCDENTLLSPHELSKIIKEEGITIMWFTVGLLNQIIDDNIELFEGLDTILAGGDKLSFTHIDRLQRSYPHLEIINGYGPTENTTFSLTHKIGILNNTNIPIGKPITNSTVYILDKNDNLVPKGVMGEICLGGAGLSRGYLNQPKLTREKFVSHIFKGNERLYKTGDLGRWLKDGTVEFLGRKDNQIKLRGYRIELGEIESVLSQHEAVNSSLVMVHQDNENEKVLVAYITVNTPVNISNLKQWLSERLPYYMVPNYLEVLDIFPLNVNGKVDRSKLPLPESINFDKREEYTEPATAFEKSLAKLWEEVLGISKVGLEDNFFDIGGHSLKATKLISKIHKEFQVKLKLKDLFVHASLQSQCKLIAEAQHSGYSKIPVLTKQNGYPLSLMQRRLWILSQHQAANIAYNMSGAYVFEGDLNVRILEEAFIQLIKRHEILRTSFKEDANREILQYVTEPENVSFTIKNIDLRGTEKLVLDKYLSEDLIAPFDLSSGKLFKANIYRISDNRWVFSNVIHHIISDGWSLGIIVNELLYLYNTLLTGGSVTLTPLNVQYKDYSSWQLKELSDSRLEFHKGYWINQFKGDLPVLDLSGGKQRPITKTYNGGVYNKIISAELSNKLAEFLKTEETTLFMGLLSAVNVLFYHYTKQEDITIGSPIAGRDHADLENQIGFYVNTLALRTIFLKNDTFKTVLAKVKEVVLGAHEHQLYPFDELVSSLNITRDMSRNPLFDVQVIVQNNQDTANTELKNLAVTAYQGELPQSSVFDLVFNFVESENGLATSIIYNSDVFDSERIEQFASHLEHLLAALLQDTELPIEEVKWLSEEEKQHLLSFNSKQMDYDQSKTVIEMVNDQVNKNPEAIAIAFEGTQITYLELHERSNQLAHFLLENYTIEPNDFVGIMMDRSELMFIGILGILKAGAAYVPIDPDYPVSRKEFILKDTNVKVLLTQSDYIFDLAYYQGEIFAMDLQMDTLTNSVTNSEINVLPEHLAYIIYTSGSTGNPKGVIVTHANLQHSLAPRNDVYVPIKCFLLLSSFAFDSSVAGIFSTLTNGGKLAITTNANIANVNFIADYIVAEKVSHLLTVPSYYKLLLMALQGKETALEEVTVAGETCPISLIEDHFKSKIGQSGCQLFNEYGPTECSVWSSVHKYEEGKPVTATIGKPIANTHIYILNDKEDLVPVGVIGELHIGGNGVTKGYLNNSELTNQKFVKDPFQKSGLMYKTGDLGRWNSEGEIEFLGRKDNQVKVRGYRIELNEVQYAIEQSGFIQSAVVLTKENKSGDNELYAYLVADEALNTSDLKNYLKDLLPGYAVPAHFITLSGFPATPNGKIDTKALLEIGDSDNRTGEDYVAPQTEEEIALVNIWQTVLDKEKIGVNDRFFDLGGDSIKVLKIVNGIYNEMRLEISISDVYTYANISKLADFIIHNKKSLDSRKAESTEARKDVVNYIDAIKNSVLESLDQNKSEAIEDLYPMSDIQKGMVYESLLYEGTSIYHDQIINQRQFVNFDISVFRLAMQLMVNKHEILRTGFNMHDYEQEVQIVYKNIEIPVVYQNLSHLDSLKEKEQVIGAFLQSELAKPFDLTSIPLFRMAAFNIGDDMIVFVSQCHHAIIDGWSDSMLLTELNNLYLNLLEDITFKPEKIKASYKNYVIEHEIDKKDTEIQSFWKEELQDSSKLNIFTNTPVSSIYGNILSENEVSELKLLASNSGTTVKEVSLSAYLYMLSILNADPDVVTGLVTNNRPSCEDGDKILGCFLNTIPLRFAINYEVTVKDFILEVQHKLIALKKYERLSLLQIASLSDNQQSNENPFFDVYFNYVDFYTYNKIKSEIKENSNPDKEEESVSLIGANKTNTFLDFNVNTTGDLYHASLSLTKILKSGLTVEQVNDLYFSILRSFIASPHQLLKSVDYLGAKEKHTLLHEFNDTKHEFPSETTLGELFIKQVKNTPDKIALVFQQKEFTFAELNEKSNQLAHYLKANYTLGANDLIAVALPRSEWMITAILAIHKIGGAYVPIDPKHPQDRIDYIVQDSASALIIDAKVLGEFQAVAENYSNENLTLINKPTDVAYVLYTSGSTGNPKGCILEHSGVVNRIQWMWEAFDYTNQDVILQKTTFTFDVSVWEIFMPLCWGTKMVLCSDEDVSIPQNIETLIKNHKVTCLHFVPSMLDVFIDSLFYEAYDFSNLSSLKQVITSGEALQLNTVKKWYEKLETPIQNLYGPTEASIDVTYYTTSKQDTVIPIGKPVWNTSIYILDANNNLVPIGCSGEIYLAGTGLARGYLNRPELTAEKFVANPFAPGEKMYKTGDIGKWTSDGNIIYAGRNDNQLKIRGFRIELGEIEQCLLEIETLDSATVLARKSASNEIDLVAYIVSNQELDVKGIKGTLKKKLPEYMVPNHFVKLETLPLTLNGKLDRKKLLAISTDSEGQTVEIVKPENDVEKKILQIWKEILSKEEISVTANFFEIGGHSLRAIKLQSMLKRKIGLDFSIKDIYNRPTIKRLASDKEKSNSLLIDLQINNRKNIIYFIPPLTGSSILYHPLAKVLSNEFDSVGFQYQGLEHGEEFSLSIKEMAKSFLDEIKNRQTHEPFIVLGYSMGAAIAFEIVRELEKYYSNIDLILVDRPTTVEADQLELQNMDHQANWLLAEYKKVIKLDEEQEKRTLAFLKNNLVLNNQYQLEGKISSNIYVFEATDNKYKGNMQNWQDYTNGDFKHHYLLGTHWDAVSEQNFESYRELFRSIYKKTSIETI
ncbi:surfactin family lipopeptide synthetase A [Flavobacterium chryseum]|uniref:non-ribosomal peptide synthetase n=1 Tax=Flavobacterium sp. P3160 TaxID=2512113 RepID=UPI0010617C7D|nr:non-ribosomal peptide synthetase [Flavobacterium sp. P3160]TDO73427.1 surfactin family lipopeptide synthetase A [Flavobacterium sp. P3160]